MVGVGPRVLRRRRVAAARPLEDGVGGAGRRRDVPPTTRARTTVVKPYPCKQHQCVLVSPVVPHMSTPHGSGPSALLSTISGKSIVADHEIRLRNLPVPVCLDL